MSSELERLLREARRGLPHPDEGVTRRARTRAIEAARRRRSLRGPAAALIAAALVGLGVTVGALVAPRGKAAPGITGLGFLPERGWAVVQNGGDGTTADPAVAIAANVQLSRDDANAVLPLSTLETLPRQGVVMIVTFAARGHEPLYDQFFPHRRLPFRARDAEPFGVQVRPGRPLGQYQLRASANGQDVEVNLYFGTNEPSPSLFDAAQQQLDRLVVTGPAALSHPAGAVKPEPVPSVPRMAATRLVDRTFSCGPRYITVAASPHGSLESIGESFVSSGSIRVSSGPNNLLYDLAGVALPGFRTRGTRFPAAVYASRTQCAPSRAFVPLTQKGLLGPAAEFNTRADCTSRGRVLVRLHAVVGGTDPWGRIGSTFVGIRAGTVQGELAVRDQKTGKPLALAKLGSGGTTKLWTSATCY